jgi:hypothetical protein
VLDGGDTGEFFPGNGHGSSSTATSGGVERGLWCGWGEADGTLLGPEGTTLCGWFL